jgi:enoyl-CoA hydratase/carnithine racemase
MSTTDKMISRKEGGVGYLIFNNPDRLNAVSLEMWQAVIGILDDFAKDRSIRVVVLTGAGEKAFVSGADISKFENERANEEAIALYNETVDRANAAIENFPKPTIAMIRGYCVGGGLGIALGCDIRICGDNARFALPAAKLGLGYGFNGIKRFVDTVGPSFTKEFFFTARQFDAEEARTMGLANRVLPLAELEAYVKKYADMIAANAPLTIEGTKFIVGETLKDESQRDMKRCAELVDRCFKSADYKEGRKAFMEKRKPVFTGR